MIYLLAAIIFWAVWRRAFGGWLSLPRPAIVVVGVLVAAGQFYFTHGLAEALFAAGLTGLFWTPGHNFRKNSALWKRYFVVGIPWMLLEKYEGKRPLGMGWTELAELGAGGIFGAIIWSIGQVG